MEEEQIRKIIKSKLSEERYYHSLCVAEQCEILGNIYHIPIVEARKMALVHDMAKELSKEEKIQYALKNNITVNAIEQVKPSLLHGKIAAGMAKKEFNFTEEMCNAIACHTTGKEKMTLLDKILFVADAIGKDRQWQGIENVRQLAKENINKTVLYLLDMTIKEKLERKELIHPDSILARNSIIMILDKI